MSSLNGFGDRFQRYFREERAKRLVNSINQEGANGFIVRSYVARSQSDAIKEAVSESVAIEAQGFEEDSKNWQDGGYKATSMFFAFAAFILLSLVAGPLIAIFMVVLYMVIVKPKGELTVTYKKKPKS